MREMYIIMAVTGWIWTLVVALGALIRWLVHPRQASVGPSRNVEPGTSA